MNSWIISGLITLSGLVGFLSGKTIYETSTPPPVVSKTTTQYNDLWKDLTKAELTHKFELAQKDLKYLRKLGCRRIMVNYILDGSPTEARFLWFTKTGKFNFIRLEINGETKDYDIEGILNRTYKVECR